MTAGPGPRKVNTVVEGAKYVRVAIPALGQVIDLADHVANLVAYLAIHPVTPRTLRLLYLLASRDADLARIARGKIEIDFSQSAIHPYLRETLDKIDLLDDNRTQHTA